MSEKAYLNGELIEIDQAAVPVSNPSLLHGVGLFETLRCYEGRPFRLQRHIDRMAASAKYFDMPVLGLIEQIPEAVTAVLRANSVRNARVRFTVTPPGSHGDNEKPTLLVGFLTNAVMEIMPVTRIERKTVGSEKPGAITRQLAEAYKGVTAAEASDPKQSE